ncbi:hypothetical protein Q7P37_010251 [Cladosporium fusiforme]
MYPSTSTSTSTHHQQSPHQRQHNRQPSPEPFTNLSIRNSAAETLQSYELLSSWHAMNRNESLAQTRLHFLSVLSGFSAEDEAAQEDWKTDLTPLVHGQGKERERERGSLGGGSPATGKGKEKERGVGSPAGSGSGSGRKKRRSAAGGGS